MIDRTPAVASTHMYTRRPCRNGLASGATRRAGFTLPEMLVASVVVTVALTGIHVLLFRALDTEAIASRRWNDRDLAEAAASRIAESLTFTTRAPEGLRSLAMEDPSPDGGAVICQTPPARLRLSWQRGASQEQYDLYLRSKPFAGSKDLSIGSVAEDAHGPEQWDHVPKVLIATGLADVRVELDRATENAPDANTASEGGQTVAVSIYVASGTQVARRVVVLSSNLVDGGSGQEGDHD